MKAYKDLAQNIFRLRQGSSRCSRLFVNRSIKMKTCSAPVQDPSELYDSIYLLILVPFSRPVEARKGHNAGLRPNPVLAITKDYCMGIIMLLPCYNHII